MHFDLAQQYITACHARVTSDDDEQHIITVEFNHASRTKGDVTSRVLFILGQTFVATNARTMVLPSSARTAHDNNDLEVRLLFV